ncbi:hypothetical protein CEF21_11040 [Bacillus sp. FJAT-42376]|uniref:hypothetical protein n=1 Tax=Bacillus sp. FJAT-42376 TaxID=2014076 RepID=UPI000F4EB4F6|nr:hypothetical protein [Bacillus sp. FJAT-42376]AZB42787.1 hypothetical protein CEF21_11040 [Bacillus sp. FJAT-42376]
MRSLQDTLYNWLSIKVVALDRTDDPSAFETAELFEKLLREDHGVEQLTFHPDEDMYWISCVQNGEEYRTRFPKELIDVMKDQMRKEPGRFRNYI